MLDAFGGTGAVSYALKKSGKGVTYNDILRFNHQVGLALIENDRVMLTDADVERLIEQAVPNVRESQPTECTFVERTFGGIYFTTEENRWLDGVVHAIRKIRCRYRRALSWYVVFQAALAKRPYNLFHRANLYMREADVSRSFGNKSSWDRPFDEHVRKFAKEANAAVVPGNVPCHAICSDAMKLEPTFDLVYIDPPYISGRKSAVDYHGYYHFLEGLVRYGKWSDLIDWDTKNLRMKRSRQPWTDPARSRSAFQRFFRHYADANIAVSYRSDGIPGIEELAADLRQVKTKVVVHSLAPRQYALSNNKANKEMLLVGTNH